MPVTPVTPSGLNLLSLVQTKEETPLPTAPADNSSNQVATLARPKDEQTPTETTDVETDKDKDKKKKSGQEQQTPSGDKKDAKPTKNYCN